MDFTRGVAHAACGCTTSIAPFEKLVATGLWRSIRCRQFTSADGPQGYGYNAAILRLQPQLFLDFLYAREEFSKPMDPGNLLFRL